MILMRRVAALGGVLATLLFLVSASSPFALAEGSTASPSNCSLAGQTIPPVSNSTATSIAGKSSQFLLAVQGKSYHLSGFAASWSCTTLESIDANFIATNSTGHREVIVVAMAVTADRTPVAVSSIRIIPVVVNFTCSQNQSGGCQQSLTNWSGYSFCNGHNSGGAYCQNPPTNPIQSVYGLFNQPSISQPTGANQPGCMNSQCTLAIWVGLVNCTGCTSGGELLQTGTVGSVQCSILLGCSTTYNVFWEDYPNNSAQYCSWSPTPGDVIYEHIYLASGNNYYVYTDDSTSNMQCTSTPYPYTMSHTPYWGQFFLEDPPGTDLAKFGNFWFQGQIGYGGSSFPINTLFGNGWYEADTPLENGAIIDVCSGSWSPPTCSPHVQSGSTGWGEFYNTWVSSQNT